MRAEKRGLKKVEELIVKAGTVENFKIVLPASLSTQEDSFSSNGTFAAPATSVCEGENVVSKEEENLVDEDEQSHNIKDVSLSIQEELSFSNGSIGVLATSVDLSLITSDVDFPVLSRDENNQFLNQEKTRTVSYINPSKIVEFNYQNSFVINPTRAINYKPLFHTSVYKFDYISQEDIPLENYSGKIRGRFFSNAERVSLEKHLEVKFRNKIFITGFVLEHDGILVISVDSWKTTHLELAVNTIPCVRTELELLEPSERYDSLHGCLTITKLVHKREFQLGWICFVQPVAIPRTNAYLKQGVVNDFLQYLLVAEIKETKLLLQGDSQHLRHVKLINHDPHIFMYGKLTDDRKGSSDKMEINLEVVIMLVLNNYCIDLMSAAMELCIYGAFLLHTGTGPVMFKTLKQQMVSSLAIFAGVIPLWCSQLMDEFPSQFSFEEGRMFINPSTVLYATHGKGNWENYYDRGKELSKITKLLVKLFTKRVTIHLLQHETVLLDWKLHLDQKKIRWGMLQRQL
ncbi:uncharacterized protein LOC113315731 [Papaver somniferum]|uniref:uncharacterized protein LOC113315731 n=1 Tax=Papaver somniferum TaxID=3469 RepID=UPI000E6F7232|nr:uncharacterized protein LOC113315731 [Papaver somniferum]